ncbi:MAG: hypothetical protein Q8M99_07290 [Methylotenera sp.]|nr:hypothetical protein [Methylotenera sp.]
MFKSLLLFAMLAVTFTACEKQKEASSEVGAIPKQILDKAKTDISNASELAAKQLQDVENIDAPEIER